jgi:hypothetical protein
MPERRVRETRLCKMQVRALFLLFLALVACGGASGTGQPKSTAQPEKHESIGELAAAQGGLASLGGAGNREESTGTEVAFSGPLRAESLSRKSPPKLDGMLGEWHARATATETLSGSGDGLSLGVAVQSGDDVLWIAAEVTDAKLVRSATHATNEDHVRLTIAFPAGRGVLKAYEIGLWPGIPGSTPGAVKWTAGPNAGQPVAGAKLVENDVKGGLTIEATVPWSNFPNAIRVGMRAAFRYHDASGSVIGTGYGSVEAPTDLPALPIAAEHAVVEGLLEKRGLASTKPKIDLYADVAGNEKKERISVFGPFFVICGPGYRNGRQFFWREVGGEIASLEAAPATGRSGKDDLVVRRRVTQNNVVHEILEVWSIPDDKEEPVTLFAQEIAISDGKRRVSNAARVAAKEIEITTEPAHGWDAASFSEPSAGGVDPILLPWGPVKSRSFKLDAGRFVKANEVTQAPSAAAPVAKAEPPKDVPTPAAQKPSANLGKQVLDLYVKDAGLAANAKPKFDVEVNVDGDAKPERVAVFGRDIVVLGPGFKNGTGYARLTLSQFAEDKDVGEIAVRDLTGDGAAEIIVRGTRRAKGPSGEVEVDALFLYQVKSGAIARIFGIETGRAVGANRVQGLVQFVPSKSGKAFDVDVQPGTAKGFTQSTYPFPEEKPGTGPLEPLLLPWGTTKKLRYSWTGSEFALAR